MNGQSLFPVAFPFNFQKVVLIYDNLKTYTRYKEVRYKLPFELSYPSPLTVSSAEKIEKNIQIEKFLCKNSESKRIGR